MYNHSQYNIMKYTILWITFSYISYMNYRYGSPLYDGIIVMCLFICTLISTPIPTIYFGNFFVQKGIKIKGLYLNVIDNAIFSWDIEVYDIDHASEMLISHRWIFTIWMF